MTERRPFLPGYALFAAMLASAGLPIYIHAPKVYVDEYGVSLAALGAVLFGLRLFDVVQDPVLGWVSTRLRDYRRSCVFVAGVVMTVAMIGLFAVAPPVAPLLWFAITLTLLFTGFSFLTISFYAQGVEAADRIGAGGHVRLAAWRETGSLLGISVAAALPTALAALTGAPFALFAAGFAGLAVLAVAAMWQEWRVSKVSPAAAGGLGPVLADGVTRRLLLIALINATPVAVSSTLFLFFVESRLGAPGWEGPLLLLFFLAAALSAPLWARAARAVGTKRVLLFGMGLAIVSFGFAALLGNGDIVAFAVICLASGAALGADMTLLPAIFARRMSVIAPEAGQAFGLWSFVSKFTLAFAAVTLLPLLDATGFQSGGENSGTALMTLTLLYALVPCILKLVAIALLAATPLKED
ncbi:MAG: MFS transporter [Pseudomonadota bacterium]